MVFGQKIIFFKTNHPTALKFGIQVPGDDKVQKCSNFDEICYFLILGIFFFTNLAQNNIDQTAFKFGIQFP